MASLSIQTAENPGTFADDVVDDSDEGVNKYAWQDLVRQLQSKKENYNPLEKAKGVWCCTYNINQMNEYLNNLSDLKLNTIFGASVIKFTKL